MAQKITAFSMIREMEYLIWIKAAGLMMAPLGAKGASCDDISDTIILGGT